MNRYNFSRLIKKYSRPTHIIVGGGGGRWVAGEWIENPPKTERIDLAIIPFDVKAIAQLGGQVTSADAQIYSLTELKHGDKIEQNGQKYKVDTSANFTSYGDFHRYIAKGVSSFD